MDFGEVMRSFSGESSKDHGELNWGDQPMTELTALYQLYNAGIKEVRTKLEILDSEFLLKYEHDPIHHIEYRLKSPRSVAQKLKSKGLPLTKEAVWMHVQDVAGIRIICSYIEDIYQISGLLISQSDVTLVRKKDYIQAPKESGYRSLHLVVSIPVYLSDCVKQVHVEVQIRTIAMDFWASLEHQIKYKSGSSISGPLRTELRDCADAICDLDRRMQRIHQKISTEGAGMQPGALGRRVWTQTEEQLPYKPLRRH